MIRWYSLKVAQKTTDQWLSLVIPTWATCWKSRTSSRMISESEVPLADAALGTTFNNAIATFYCRSVRSTNSCCFWSQLRMPYHDLGFVVISGPNNRLRCWRALHNSFNNVLCLYKTVIYTPSYIAAQQETSDSIRSIPGNAYCFVTVN